MSSNIIKSFLGGAVVGGLTTGKCCYDVISHTNTTWNVLITSHVDCNQDFNQYYQQIQRNIYLSGLFGATAGTIVPITLVHNLSHYRMAHRTTAIGACVASFITTKLVKFLN